MGRRGCPALPGTRQRRWIPGTPGTASFTLPTPLASGNYYWVVRAQNGVGVGPFSAGMVFSVGGPPAAPTLIGPQGGGIGTTPAFTFTTVTGATGYQFWLTDGTTWLSSTTWYTPAQVDPGNTGYCWLHLTDAPGFRQLLLGCPGTEWGWGRALQCRDGVQRWRTAGGADTDWSARRRHWYDAGLHLYHGDRGYRLSALAH